jgi:PAS domain S-box-containing protein
MRPPLDLRAHPLAAGAGECAPPGPVGADLTWCSVTASLFHSLPVPAWIVDPVTRTVLVANPAAQARGTLVCSAGADPLGAATVVTRDGRTQRLVGRRSTVQHDGRDAWLVAEAGAGAREASILAALPDLWFLIDQDLRYIDVSDAQDPRLVGRWEDALGRRFGEVLPADVAARAEAAMLSSRARHTVERVEYEVRLADGRAAVFDARIVPLPEGGWLYLTRDITELRAAEQRFRAVAEGAPIGIFMADADGACIYTNARWQTIYGLTAEQALGDGWARGVHPQDRERVGALWALAVRERRPFEAELRLCTSDGTEREVRARSQPIVDGSGRVTGHVGAVENLDDARRLARAESARRRAEEASRAKTEFLSRMSHELRTPLNAILGFGQLLELEAGADPKRVAQQAAQIVGAGRLMLSMVEDLLELQAIEAGRATVQVRNVSLRPLVAQVASLLAPLASPRGVTIELHMPGHLVVRTDERRLQQILVNLGSNAVKYNRPAGQVRFVAEVAVDGRLALSVEDTGEGLTAEEITRLFQPFERLGRERGPVPGTGLGLAIARQFAEMLGGELEIDSTPGVGTRVVLRLPVA